MIELAVAERPKQQDNALTPLELKTLGKGIGNINSEYPLHEVITFIRGLNVNTSVWTSQSENALEIAFSTPSFFTIKRLKEFDSTIYLTGPLKKQEPEFRAQGKRQIWRPTGFVASILLSNDKEENNQRVKEIILSTELSKKELELMTKGTIGEIPYNWHVNSHAAKSVKSAT